MEEALNGAIRYHNGDPSGNEGDAGENPWEKYKEARIKLEEATAGEEEELSYRQMKERIAAMEKNAFNRLEGMDEADLEHALSEQIRDSLNHTQAYIDRLVERDNPDHEAVRQIMESVEEMTGRTLGSMVEKGDEEGFKNYAYKLGDMDQSLARRLETGEGNIQHENYAKPALQHRFDTPEELASYVNLAEETLQEWKGEMTGLRYNIGKDLLNRLDQRMEAFDESGLAAMPREELDEAHRIAEGLDFLLRPRDDEVHQVWNAADPGPGPCWTSGRNISKRPETKRRASWRTTRRTGPW